MTEKLGARRGSALAAEAPEGARALEERRIDAARSPFEMAGRSRPRPVELTRNVSGPDVPRGRALDLSALGDWDLAHFEPLERLRPTKVSDRAKTAYSPENVKDFEGYVRRGIREGGLDWYDMSPLSRVALNEMSPKDFNVLMAMNAGASARSAVQDQIKRASLAWYYRKQGIPWPMDNKDLIEQAGEGYGHLAHDIHSKHLGPLVAGEDPGFSSIDQPKYASYHNNFMGNLAPLTADTHYQALHGYPMKETYNKYNKKWIEAPDFSKNVDYPFAEAFSGERARRMGIPTAGYQSAAWVGGRDATGVRDARPFAAVYDDLVGRTADQMDISPLEALKKHLRGELPLMPIERATGGPVHLAGGGIAGKLEEYIRSRLPRQYASHPMKHLSNVESDATDSFGGSSRDIFGLGDDKLVKLAKRPRGMHEMSLEGDGAVADNLPKLHWRSDDNELAVIERMNLTPRKSAEFFEPMQHEFESAATYKRPMYALHRTHGPLSRMMDESGLGNFKNFDIHGPDFFMAPEHHWAMRDPGARGKRDWGTPTLLDPGALDHRITDPQFERSMAGDFYDVLSNRLKSMYPVKRPKPEELIENALNEGDIRLVRPYGMERGVEDFYGPSARFAPASRPENVPSDQLADEIRKLMPRTPTRSIDQGTFGFATGGMLAARLKRMKYAGGGVVRNWLRGVKGSRFDKVIDQLKQRVSPIEDDVESGMRALNPEAADRYRQDPETVSSRARAQAMSQWIDKNFANYMARQMGAPGDPLEEMLAGQTRMAVRQMPPSEAPTWLAPEAPTNRPDRSRFKSKKAYDAEFDRLESERLSANRTAIDTAKHEMPSWLRKHYDEDALRAQFKNHLKPSTTLHDIDESGWTSYMQDPTHGVLDYLTHRMTPNDQGIVDLQPEQLARMSVPDAFKGSHEWHEQLARKAEEAKNKALASGDWFKTHKQYPDGFRWVKYDPEYPLLKDGEPTPKNWTNYGGKNFHSDRMDALKAALEGEGESMGHCVGGYCDSVLDGSTQIYSLRDPKGKPHVTVEVQPPHGGISGDLLMENGQQALWDDYKRNGARGDLHEFVKQRAPDFYERYVQGTSGDIVQIKGKGNRKPVDEYLPYVQDFVRSGRWGTIGDLKNTGLDEIITPTGKTHYMTQAESKPFEKLWPHSPKDANGNPVPGDVEKGRYVRGDSYVDYNVPDDWAPPQEFAKGGMVQHADFPREQPAEQLMRAQFALKILMEEIPHASAEERPALMREIHHVQAIIEELSGAGGGSGVKDELVSPYGGAPADDDLAGDDSLADETLAMLGRFVGGDPGSEDYLHELLSEEHQQ